MKGFFSFSRPSGSPPQSTAFAAIFSLFQPAFWKSASSTNGRTSNLLHTDLEYQNTVVNQYITTAFFFVVKNGYSVFFRLSHFVPCQPLILPSFWHREHIQWISLLGWNISTLVVPGHPFSKHLILVADNLFGLMFVVVSITNAKKLASSLASLGICWGIFPFSSRKWVMLEMYILKFVMKDYCLFNSIAKKSSLN